MATARGRCSSKGISHRPAAGERVHRAGHHAAIERENILRVISRAPILEDAAKTVAIDSSTLWRKRKRYEEV
jgi:NtrC-family two-component system response regulator AlgB